MATKKQIRINRHGKIVGNDRKVHVNQEDGAGNADRVEFRYVGNVTTEFTIDFTPYDGTPFVGGAAATKFAVPLGNSVTHVVSRDVEPDEYEYNVIESANPANITDDPDVIVD